MHLLSRHCSYPRDHEIPSPSALLNEVPSILKSIYLVLKGYFREGWFDLGAHREPGEYNLEMVCSCVCRARQRTQRREWAAWAVKASETVMNREPAALLKGPEAPQLQLTMPPRTVDSGLPDNWSFQEKGRIRVT